MNDILNDWPATQMTVPADYDKYNSIVVTKARRNERREERRKDRGGDE